MQSSMFEQAGAGDHVSFCRICSGGCGTIVTVDDSGRIARIRGDRKNSMSRGYACFKGVQSGDSHHGAARLLRPLAKSADGTRRELGLESALDEIGGRLGAIIDEHGPDSVALLCGNGSLLHASAFAMQRSFMAAIGSSQFFTTLTIDQSAKLVSFGRLGAWAGGSPELEQMDCALMFGANPLVSHSSLGFLTADPVKRLRDAKRRGLKLITVDPRATETAAHADLALQPYPGWDAAIAGAMLRIILAEGWHDAAFCDRFVGADRMAALTQAVAPLDASRVEAAAGLRPGDIRAASEMFARDSQTGCAYGATGPNMARASNLAQHLMDNLNVVCGRVLRAGAPVTRVPVLDPPSAPYEGVIGADRPWDALPPSRIRGVDSLYGERLSATLADEILTPGRGQIKALIVNGGDPAVSLPGQQRALEALRSLDLLVSIDPWMGPTASLADYVLPPLLQYERADMTAAIPGFPMWPGKWAQYTPAIIDPPKGSDLADDWYMYWGLAKRLGKPLTFVGKQLLDSDTAPTTDELMAIQLDGAVADVDELRSARHGVEYPVNSVVQAANDGDCGRFDVMPSDVAAELAEFIGEAFADGQAPSRRFVLSSRRMRDFFNSNGIHNEAVRRRNPYNPVYINGHDLAELGAEAGNVLTLESDYGSVQAIAQADDTMRPGVVALPHGWGGATSEQDTDCGAGACVNRLTSATGRYEAINAMPHFSSIGIDIRPAAAVAAAVNPP